MRYVVAGLSVLALAGCSQAPNGSEASDAATSAAGVAFNYSYGFRLPSASIADAQDDHAQACERLGAGRCRITGMNYHVDDGGAVSAALEMKLAAPIARSFARQGVKAVEAAGGALTAAQITGTDAALAETEIVGAEVSADTARVTRDLARPGLSSAERAELIRQREAAIARERAGVREVASTRGIVAETPVAFRYEAGRGVGLTARLSDAGQTALASVVATLGFVLDALALLGPPALLLILLFALWRRWGRHWWARLMGDRVAYGAPAEPSPASLA